MSRRVDLTDPDLEPTDEELTDLARRAFEPVKEQNARLLVQLREEIARARAEAIARIAGPE